MIIMGVNRKKKDNEYQGIDVIDGKTKLHLVVKSSHSNPKKRT